MADGEKKSVAGPVALGVAAIAGAGALVYAYTQGWFDDLLGAKKVCHLTVRVLKNDESPVYGAGVNIGATSVVDATYQDTDANGETFYDLPYGTFPISIVSNVGNKTEHVTLATPAYTLVSHPGIVTDPDDTECEVSGKITKFGGVGLSGARFALIPSDATLPHIVLISDATGALPPTLVPKGTYAYGLTLSNYIGKSGTLDATGATAVVAIQMDAESDGGGGPPPIACTSVAQCSPERPFCVNGACQGEQPYGTNHIRGVVKDQFGAIVPHAVVEFMLPAGETKVLTDTDANGAYDTLLDAGNYRYKISKLDHIPLVSTVNIIMGDYSDVVKNFVMRKITGAGCLFDVWVRVRTSAGVAVPGATVEAMKCSMGTCNVPTGQTAITDSAGVAHLIYEPPVDGDNMTVYAYLGEEYIGQKDGSFPAVCGTLYPADPTKYVEITATVAGAQVVVSGTLKEFGTGVSLSGVTCTFTEAGQTPIVVIASGTYAVTVKAGVPYTVKFEKAGYVTQTWLPTGAWVPIFNGNYTWDIVLTSVVTTCPTVPCTTGFQCDVATGACVRSQYIWVEFITVVTGTAIWVEWDRQQDGVRAHYSNVVDAYDRASFIASITALKTAGDISQTQYNSALSQYDGTQPVAGWLEYRCTAAGRVERKRDDGVWFDVGVAGVPSPGYMTCGPQNIFRCNGTVREQLYYELNTTTGVVTSVWNPTGDNAGCQGTAIVSIVNDDTGAALSASVSCQGQTKSGSVVTFTGLLCGVNSVIRATKTGYLEGAATVNIPAGGTATVTIYMIPTGGGPSGTCSACGHGELQGVCIGGECQI